MKTSIFFLFILLFLTACEKEYTAPATESNPDILLTFYNDDDNDCMVNNCEAAIAATKAANQALADFYCDTIWQEIICCYDGLKTYALVYTAPRCAEPELPLGY